MGTNLRRLVPFVALSGICAAQGGAAQDVAGRMDQIVQSYVANKQFMGTALVARGDQVIFSKGYGSANLEWSIPNSPNTKFRLGSLTKQFTATAILLLEERGKLNTSDLVKKYVPDAPAAWDKMTVYNVLTHTAGIPNYTALPAYQALQDVAVTPEKLVATFRDLPLDFQPGEKFNYSNSGYVLLGYIVEKVSGQSYERFLQENIFTPLGMKDSGYDSNSTVIARRASGYGQGPEGPLNAPYVHMSVPYAAGALYATTEDLLRWEQGLFGGKVLKPASLAKMTTPFKEDYAFGVGVHVEDGHKIVDHAGGINGFTTHLSYYPDDKLTVAVLSNLGGPGPDLMAPQLAKVAFGGSVTLQSERKALTMTAAELGRFVGVYRMAAPVNAPMTVALDGTQLSAQLAGQPPIPVFPSSETMFFMKVVDAQVEFPAGTAPADRITLHQNGRDLPGTRMSDAEAKPILDAAAAAAQRAKAGTATPGGEAALRALIEGTRAGTPDYSKMNDALAAATRQQLPMLQSTIAGLGAVQSVTFKNVVPPGFDVYEVKFEKGTLEYGLVLGADGKIEGARFRPVQ